MIHIIEYVFCALLFLIPWQARIVLFPGVLNGGSWEYGTISLYATDVLFFVILILSVVWAVRVSCNECAENRHCEPRHSGAWQSTSRLLRRFASRNDRRIIILVAFAFLSVLWSTYHGVAMYAALKLFEGVALMFLISYLPLNRTRLLWALIAGAVAQSVLVVVQFSTQHVTSFLWSGIAPQNPMTPGVAVIEAGGRRWLRAYGSFPHPNILGGYFSIVLILVLGYWKDMTNAMWRVSRTVTVSQYAVVTLSVSLIAIGLFLSFSRAAWIALVVGIVIWFIQHRAWQMPVVRIGGAAILAIGILYSALFWPLIASRVTGVGRLELKSTSERMQYIRESVALVRSNALFGVGIGNYTAAVHDELRPNNPSWSYQPVHNVFLLVFAELGFIGVVLFILLLRQLATRNSKLLILNSALIILFLFDHSFWTLHSGILLFWLAIALQKNQENKGL